MPIWREREAAKQEARALLALVQTHYTPLDAKTLKRLHAYNARETAAMPPTLSARLAGFLCELRARLRL